MMLMPVSDIDILSQFLRTPTPQEWLDYAVKHIPLLLIDHAHCERKAAATAINFMSKYPEQANLVAMMSPLAREELLHFEKVIALLQEREITFGPLPSPLYAQRLHNKVTQQRTHARLCDELIVGAIIEARSCERFNALVSVLDDFVLAKFYASLVKAEARHFQDYLRLAYHYGGDQIESRIAEFLDLENELIIERNVEFRFHSGIPC